MNIKRGLSSHLSTLHFVYFLIIWFSLIGLNSCDSANQKWESFGAKISSESVEGSRAMMEKVTTTDSIPVKFEAEIAEVCQMKGCWMTLKTDDGSSIRVTFKDYGFFVPKDAGGKKVIIEGKAISSNLDEETARHYAKDAGKEFDENSSLTEISVVASGVLIEKTPSQL